MFCISIVISYSFYESVSWDIFLRSSSIFAWISWNFFSFFISEDSVWTYCWCVRCKNCFTIFIFSNNRYTRCCSYEFRFWSERYFSVRIDSVSSLTWYYFCSFSVFECWWYIFIDISFEYWSIWLRFTFWSFRFYIFSWCCS